MNKKQPIVFLLDFDGTMQGNIRPQIEEFNLITNLNKIILNSKKIKYNTEFLVNDMVSGLMRPDLKRSLIKMKQRHPNIEFYIYTASQDEWANFILPKFCHYLNDKLPLINKPFFTRKHCESDGTKSIKRVKRMIETNLHSKYRNKYDSKLEIESIYLIDNNFVLPKKELSHLVYCPTYDFKMSIDLLRTIDKTLVLKYYKEIAAMLFENPDFSNHVEFMYRYYEQLHTQMKTDHETNKAYLRDDYWSKVANVVTTYELSHKANIVKMINKLCRIK
jgi:hypothetical protein